jgi:hypothetical protein
MIEFLTVILMMICAFTALHAGIMLLQCLNELYHRIFCGKDKKKNNKWIL